MSNEEYKITTIQPQSQNVDTHSFYSSSITITNTHRSDECCGNCSEDEKRCYSCMCTSGLAIVVSIILIKYAC